MILAQKDQKMVQKICLNGKGKNALLSCSFIITAFFLFLLAHMSNWVCAKTQNLSKIDKEQFFRSFVNELVQILLYM